ncbi:CDP-diacylglycerol--glycerol-3-phosphate 3-phosphatidyltransferase [Thiococcus pfennigii]|jgi:CDP-diacylglycerol--glycerol-3-phosphate 3-phosphatidyltransferase|uniref:CDP-diacylglycerol--glycerol-3-phosphate 3-phosphatidyltransferase n=1 Tax=Thiococcus pfennigii TaxID=1057 RepID=UPI0019053A11|nr:CDP-diacylglycerol--glycerol-3-phosphate 3-phosphatidyltransferase [Thiococcus pfennigii]MBK1700878.1 CDP-diacylglycerol--glycerol-3-phosphate 3-phosphatidyltransferase [Thiococcus pfennigii]MBK1732668.1 CDP-diacylglycerol--glycerol-3-phosphate 3-phosphatidyltransferase [Thiococcus pfennigii]
MWNIPNILTLVRIALIPVLVGVFYWPASWAPLASAGIFTAAALTDLLDGYLARRWDQTSPFGAFLDPVADKLMVAVALVLLVQADPSPLLATAAAVIIGREITVSALREWMAMIGARARVAVSLIGKFKTAAQMVAITLLLMRNPVVGVPIYSLGIVLLYLAACLTLWSMMVYLRAAWPSLSAPASVHAKAKADAVAAQVLTDSEKPL